MGLDGLSINNLMLNKANTSKENAIQAEALAVSKGAWDKSVDQLQGKQAIETGDKNNPSFSGGFTDGMDEENEEEVEDDDVQDDDFVEIDDSPPPTSEEVQEAMRKIKPEELSRLVGDLKQINGVFVNKKI